MMVSALLSGDVYQQNQLRLIFYSTFVKSSNERDSLSWSVLTVMRFPGFEPGPKFHSATLTFKFINNAEIIKLIK